MVGLEGITCQPVGNGEAGGLGGEGDDEDSVRGEHDGAFPTKDKAEGQGT